MLVNLWKENTLSIGDCSCFMLFDLMGLSNFSGVAGPCRWPHLTNCKSIIISFLMHNSTYNHIKSNIIATLINEFKRCDILVNWLTRDKLTSTCAIVFIIHINSYEYWCISTYIDKVKFICLNTRKNFLSLTDEKDRKANERSNILTLTWLDSFALEGEARRVNPAETCACACKSDCTLFSHSAVRFLSM